MHMSNHDARTMPLKDVPSICICTCTYALCRKYVQGGEMYPRRGSWGVRCCFWLWPGTQGIGYRHAWWVCDVSHFSTGLTYLAMHLPVLFFNVYFVLCIKVKRAGTAVDENEGVDLCRVSLVLSKSIHLDPYTLTLDGAFQIDSSRRAHDSPCWHCRT